MAMHAKGDTLVSIAEALGEQPGQLSGGLKLSESTFLCPDPKRVPSPSVRFLRASSGYSKLNTAVTGRAREASALLDTGLPKLAEK